MLTAIGNSVVGFIEYLYDVVEMIVFACRDCIATVRHGSRPILNVYLRQVYFTGLEALKIILVISLIIGTVIITQINTAAGAQSASLTGKIIVWIVLRELGPLLTAIIVVARSGTAIAAELSQMKIAGEIDALTSLGIPPAHYLIMPRIFGVATAVGILTIYFETAALLGGFLVANVGWHVPWQEFSQGAFSVLTLGALAGSIAKAICFGLGIAATCCRQGLSVGRSVTFIPQAATRGVMQSLLLLLVVDGLVSLCSLL